MSRLSNRQSLNIIQQKSLKESRFSEGQSRPLTSSFDPKLTSRQLQPEKSNGKKQEKTTFYKLLQENGYIKEMIQSSSKSTKREWHVKKRDHRFELDSDSD